MNHLPKLTVADYDDLAAQPEIQIVISPLDALCLLAVLQLALRHPANNGPASEVAREFAHRLEERISVNDKWKAVCAAGWNPDCDVERKA